jgi:hypothetical protein
MKKLGCALHCTEKAATNKLISHTLRTSITPAEQQGISH